MNKVSIIAIGIKYIVAAFLIGGLLFIPASRALAQSTDSSNTAFFKEFNKTHVQPTGNIVQAPENSTAGKSNEYWIADRLCIALLVFAFFLCAGEILLFLKGKIDQVQILKLLILTLIVFSILFLITAGYDNAQTQTSVGLFGTIAGYLLGRSVPDSSSGSNTKTDTEPKIS